MNHTHAAAGRSLSREKKIRLRFTFVALFIGLGASAPIAAQPVALSTAQRAQADFASLKRIRELGSVTLRHLREDDLQAVFQALGAATDLSTATWTRDETALSAAAAGLHRKVMQLDAEERYELLRKWSFPAESRRSVRVLTSVVPLDAPPKAFARAIGERPREDSFPTAEVNGVSGLFSSAWLLVTSAEEAGRSRSLLSDLQDLSEGGVPGARYVMDMAQVIFADKENETLASSVKQRLAMLRHEEGPELAGQGPVPPHLLWQFGYRDANTDRRVIEFKPFPYFDGFRWKGSSEYPDQKLGWIMMQAQGGHTGARFSPVRRWVAPADGMLAIAGQLKHLSPQGDGVRARIVSSRSGEEGNWQAMANAVPTPVDSIQVRAWDTIDFIVDQNGTPSWDNFEWAVRLTLQQPDGEVVTYDSDKVRIEPKPRDVLADVAFAATCLLRPWQYESGEAMIAQSIEDASQPERRLVPVTPPFVQSLLQRAKTVAIANRSSGRDSHRGDAQPEHWVVGAGDSFLGALGKSSPWLVYDDHVLSAADRSALLFRYPLSGTFQFSCEVQLGVTPETSDGVAYGGIQFTIDGAQKQVLVHDSDGRLLARKECPFVRSGGHSVFNQLSIKSTESEVTFLVNGHPMWTSRASRGSWIELRTTNGRRPLFRNLTLAGAPVIPRVVRMSEGDQLRGWAQGQARQPALLSPPREGLIGFRIDPPAQPGRLPRNGNWISKDGEISEPRASDAAGSVQQSHLHYLRPLQNGDSVSYSFFYEAGKVEVHPSLGRLAFLLDPTGVRLHWITVDSNEWTGLREDNAIAEPLFRRGPRTLPLKAGAWNQVLLSLVKDKVTLTLNDQVIYERPIETDAGRQFGLFHFRGRSAARLREVVLNGNWPQTLPVEIMSNLAAAGNAAPPAYLSELFNEDTLAKNVLSVLRRISNLPDDEQYSSLSDWVLPGRGRVSLRISGVFADPAASDSARHRDAQLASPAYALVDTATRLGRLEELRERVLKVLNARESKSETGRKPIEKRAVATSSSRAPALPSAVEQETQRACWALLFLIEAARQNYAAAEAACEQLMSLREAQEVLVSESLWPETLVSVRGQRDPNTRTIVSELTGRLLEPLLRGESSDSDVWDHQIVSLLGRQSIETSILNREPKSPLNNWVPASVVTASTRGQAYPPARWERHGDQVVKLSPHHNDFLFYRIPLNGDFDVEFSTTPYAGRYAGVMFGGVFHSFLNAEACTEGTLRSSRPISLAPPISHEHKPIRMRLRVRSGNCTTFVNGRAISSRELPPHHEPWLGIYSHAKHLSGVRDLSISGSPLVPAQVRLVSDPNLLGWQAYFGEQVGPGDRPAAWQYQRHPTGGGILGAKDSALEGAFKESLLQYHSPIVGDNVIEYEFYYEPGKAHVHPALDQVAFLLASGGVKVHRITDGAYAPAGSDPANASIEPDQRRGPEAIPLRAGDWNRIILTLRGNMVELTLNDELVYECPREGTNKRFGLFHYADQTEVRVRNLVLRGDWPESVPPISKQELTNQVVHSLDFTREALTAEFSHSFEPNALPGKFFKQFETGTGTLSLRRDGLYSRVETRGVGASRPISPRFVVHGDFDIELAFDQLQLKSDLYACVLLRTEHNDDDRPFYRVMRMLGQEVYDRVHASVSQLRQGRERTYDSFKYESCESSSGRLRLARRGKTFYYLFAEGDSTTFRVIGTREGSLTETVTDGIQFMPVCDGNSEMEVVWRSISIRAERMTYLPPRESPAIRQLMVMNVDGSSLRAVSSPPSGNRLVGSPEWSADGKRIVFDSARTDFADSHIFAVNADGSDLRDLGRGGMPSLSRNGKQIVFCQPGQGVKIMNSDGTDRADIDPRGWGAQWSPDGNWIAWGREGNIFVMDAKTRVQRPILVGEQANMFSSTFWNLGWSHDSRSIAFKARNRKTNGEDLIVADIDSPDRFKILLASSEGINADFSFSPDNQRILFAMHDPQQNASRLYTIERETGALPKLVVGQPQDWKILDCAWSPDGTRIAFTGERIPQPVEWPIAAEE